MITMKEIAQQAGVSQPTVSLILNKKSSSVRISEETRKKVVAVAEELGYRRNEVARSMKTGKTNVIGFISWLSTSYTMDMITGVSKVLDENDYLLKLFMLTKPPYEEQYREAARKCVEQRVAAVICHSLSDQLYNDIYNELQKHDIPLIMLDKIHPSKTCISITADETDGARQATDHLLELGHRRIGVLSVDSDAHFAITRLAGYKQALEAAGRPFNPQLIHQVSSAFQLTDDQEHSITTYLQDVKPTALFCLTDPLAMKALQVTYKLGINVPRDLSVIGFGGLDYSHIASPELTTIDQPFSLMGEEAARKAIGLAKTGKIAETDYHTYVKTRLLERESTAPPAHATI